MQKKDSNVSKGMLRFLRSSGASRPKKKTTKQSGRRRKGKSCGPLRQFQLKTWHSRTWNNKFVLEAGQTYNEKNIKHFLLIDTTNNDFDKFREKIFEQLAEYNIYPIIYEGDEHIFLENLFELLSQKEKSIYDW